MSMWMGTVGKILVMVKSVEWLQVEGTGFKYVKKYFFFSMMWIVLRRTERGE